MTRWTVDKLVGALEDGAIVPMPKERWAALADAFPVVEVHATGLAGELHLLRRPRPGKATPGWAIVERPQAGERVVRPLDSAAEARALIADRLAAYERMWDG